MNDITQPLRLAVGSHVAGSGKGCAMNLISWESGDKTITDMPACADPMLARIVQRVNDTICTHRDGDLLCPPCSQVVLALGHRTVGTSTLDLTPLERQVVWVKVAADQARQVLHLVPESRKDRALAAIEAAERWADNPSKANRKVAYASAAYASAAYASAYASSAYASAAAYAAYASADDAYAYASASAYAAYASADDADAYADDADADAYAAAYASASASADASGLALARRAFDLFEQLTQHVNVKVSDQEVADAYQQMIAV